jgi:hypothetical protein
MALGTIANGKQSLLDPRWNLRELMFSLAIASNGLGVGALGISAGFASLS